MTRQVPPGGPYVSEDMSTWYVAVEDASLIDAWWLVKATCPEGSPIYDGKRPDCHLWDGIEHSGPEEGGPCGPEMECRTTLCWTFTVLDE